MQKNILFIGTFITGILLGALLWGQAEISQGWQQLRIAVHSQNYQVMAPQPGDQVLGSPEAPVHLVIYGDYQCPYCAQWHLEVFPELLHQYGSQIQVRYRHFPLTDNNAAAASNCAAEQGAFWPYHDQLYRSAAQLSPKLYPDLAAALGLDQAAFGTCLAAEQTQLQLQAALQAGKAAGIYSTPTFFLNGVRILGAQPLAVFSEQIDALLNQAEEL